ncbi:alpha/beta hydrolase [Ameyamaea chiangmaiensis]|uniref:Alpha/beta hydrolase n=1 Tax=Ameyamaea chiangmaiensis TaxID=442969 RepID=A0A850P7Y1_9PROT|nr:alpha/beta hydrolase [Ameyamaea chiangmaiensis]NVN40707.1 alpha/beta hydrolase [Ameyamaea chiangmaiensis]
MIPGPGPVDRNGDSPQGLKAAALRRLAEGLAADGIATVRVDKRGMFGSVAAAPDANAATINAYATDVHAWTTVIHRRTGGTCVWVLGHSEGGLVAVVEGRESGPVRPPSGIDGRAALGRSTRRTVDVQPRQNANFATAPVRHPRAGGRASCRVHPAQPGAAVPVPAERSGFPD